MLRVRVFVIACVGVVIASAFAASSASALFTEGAHCEGAGVSSICITKTEGGELLEATGTEAIANVAIDSGTKLVLEWSLSEQVKMECGTFNASGVIEQASPLVSAYLLMKMVWKLTSCTIASPTGCTVAEPIYTKALEAVPLETEPGHIIVKPVKPKIWWEFSIEGAQCPAILKGIMTIKGEQLCTITAAAENLLLQLMECPKETDTTEKLTWNGSNPITLQLDFSFGLADEWFFDAVLA